MGKLKLKDIAKAAGVSPSSVTLVLKGQKGVGADKRELISSLLAENGYLTNTVINKSSSNILFLKFIDHGFLVEDNPGFMNILINSIDRSCRHFGYSLQMSSVKRDRISETIESIRANPPSGIILLVTEMRDEDIQTFINFDIPIVAVDGIFRDSPISCFTMDNEEAICKSVKYMYEKGHKHIGFLANQYPGCNCRSRREAFEYAIDKYAPDAKTTILKLHPTTDGSYISMKKHLDQGIDMPSCFIANHDCIALGSMRALKECGYRIPQDISVIGFDSIPFSAISDPPLTTFYVPCTEISEHAVQTLFNYIGSKSRIPIKSIIGTHFIERNSVVKINI